MLGKAKVRLAYKRELLYLCSSSLSTTARKEVAVRWVLVSFLRWQVMGCKGTVSSCIRGGLDWMYGRISSWRV